MLLAHTYLILPQLNQERLGHRKHREDQAAALEQAAKLQQEVARLKQKLADAETTNALLQQRAAPTISSQTSVDDSGTPRYASASLCKRPAVLDSPSCLAFSLKSRTTMSPMCLPADGGCTQTDTPPIRWRSR